MAQSMRIWHGLGGGYLRRLMPAVWVQQFIVAGSASMCRLRATSGTGRSRSRERQAVSGRLTNSGNTNEEHFVARGTQPMSRRRRACHYDTSDYPKHILHLHDGCLRIIRKNLILLLAPLGMVDPINPPLRLDGDAAVFCRVDCAVVLRVLLTLF